MEIKLSKDKLYLLFLGIVVLSAIYYFLVFAPTSEKLSSETNKKTQLNIQLDELKLLNKNSLNNRRELEEYKTKQKSFMLQYPPKLRQDYIILLISELCKMPAGTPPVQVAGITFKPVQDQKKGEATGKDQSAMDDQNINSINVGLDITGRYSSIKQFLKNVKICLPKVIAEDLQVSSADNNEDPQVTLRTQLVFLGYNDPNIADYFGKDTEKIKDNIFNYKTDIKPTKQNLFQGFPKMASSSALTSGINNVGNLNKIGVSDLPDDFYIMISPYNYDCSSVEVGKSRNGMKSLYSSINGKNRVEFTFDDKGGLRYNYKVGNGKDTQMLSFLANDKNKIIIKVIGNDINKSKDKVSVELVINNNSKVPVEVLVTGINPNANRITIKQNSGSVFQTWK